MPNFEFFKISPTFELTPLQMLALVYSCEENPEEFLQQFEHPVFTDKRKPILFR
jgi:hypothetical protein